MTTIYDVIQIVKPGALASYLPGTWLERSFCDEAKAAAFAARCNACRSECILDSVRYEVEAIDEESPERHQTESDYKQSLKAAEPTDAPETVQIQGRTAVYNVTLGPTPTCNCPDFAFRGIDRDGNRTGHTCRHIAIARQPIVTIAACSPVAKEVAMDHGWCPKCEESYSADNDHANCQECEERGCEWCIDRESGVCRQCEVAGEDSRAPLKPMAPPKPANADALIIEAVEAYRTGGTGALSIVAGRLTVAQWNSIGRRLVALGCPVLGKGIDRNARLVEFCRLACEGSPVSFPEPAPDHFAGASKMMDNLFTAEPADGTPVVACRAPMIEVGAPKVGPDLFTAEPMPAESNPVEFGNCPDTPSTEDLTDGQSEEGEAAEAVECGHPGRHNLAAGVRGGTQGNEAGGGCRPRPPSSLGEGQGRQQGVAEGPIGGVGQTRPGGAGRSLTCNWCGKPAPVDPERGLCDVCRPVVPIPEGAKPMTPNHALLAMHGIAPVCGGAPEESIDERVDYLSEGQCRDILKRIIASLVANGTVDGTLDILHSHCLLTMREARQMMALGSKRR